MAKQTLMPLTANEKMVLELIENRLAQQGIAPSFQEIREHFGFASLNSVQRYLKQLQAKNYIHRTGGNQKRSIMVLHSSNSIQSSLNQQPINHPFSTQPQRETSPVNVPTESLSVPLLGKVAAGSPIEALEYNETLDVPSHLVRHPAKSFALKVVGKSMIEDGILDGDYILVQRQEQAANGETVVAVVDNEATVKRFYVHKNKQKAFVHSSPPTSPHSESDAPAVELRPANSSMQSLWYRPDQVAIQGVVVGLIRKYY